MKYLNLLVLVVFVSCSPETSFHKKTDADGSTVLIGRIDRSLLFQEFPEVRKSDVIAATKNYLTQCISTGTQAKFVKRPQNFLWFGQGVSLEQMILSYIPEKEDQVENTHSSNVMK